LNLTDSLQAFDSATMLTGSYSQVCIPEHQGCRRQNTSKA
jgi:hypothetical protein